MHVVMNKRNVYMNQNPQIARFLSMQVKLTCGVITVTKLDIGKQCFSIHILVPVHVFVYAFHLSVTVLFRC